MTSLLTLPTYRTTLTQMGESIAPSQGGQCLFPSRGLAGSWGCLATVSQPRSLYMSWQSSQTQRC